MDLILMRHGIADDAGPANGFQDAHRSLTPEGAKRMAVQARGLAALKLGPVDVLLSSPLLRCAQTAGIVGGALGLEPVIEERLSPGARFEEIAEILDDHPDADRVWACGHQPDLSYITLDLTGGLVEFRKGGVAVIELDGVRRGGGCLQALFTPASLRAMGSA